MPSRRIVFGFAFALVMLPGGLAADAARAQDQPIKRTELLRTDLADIAGKETVIYVADVMPGAEGGRHTHYGDEFVYILNGMLIVTPDGKQPITLKEGDVAHLAPKDGVHAAKNGSKSEPAKVLVIWLLKKGSRWPSPRNENGVPWALLASDRDGRLEFAGPAILNPPQARRAAWRERMAALAVARPPVRGLMQGTAQWLRPELRLRVKHLKAKGTLRHATVKGLITD